MEDAEKRCKIDAYPELESEVHKIMLNRLDSYEEKTFDHLNGYVDAHKAYVNTKHPHFADFHEREVRGHQVWSLSRFKVSCRLITNDLDQVSPVSLLMTALTALANEGLFEQTRRP